MRKGLMILITCFGLYGCFSQEPSYEGPHVTQLVLPEGVNQQRQVQSPYIYPDGPEYANPDDRSDLLKPPQVLSEWVS